jgi:hypothetical protein
MRIIKGYASLIPYPDQGDGYKSMFLNSYNDQPISLGCGDCIIAATIESPNEIVADPGVDINIYLCRIPSGYNSQLNEWIPPHVNGLNNLTNATIIPAQLNTGLNINVDGINSPYAYYNYLLCHINNPYLIKSSNPRVNLTLLILNPIVTS